MKNKKQKDDQQFNQEFYANVFHYSPVLDKPIINQPKCVESYEGDYLTGYFGVSEQGYLFLCEPGKTRIARIVNILPIKEDKGFRVIIEKIYPTFKAGEPRIFL